VQKARRFVKGKKEIFRTHGGGRRKGTNLDFKGALSGVKKIDYMKLKGSGGADGGFSYEEDEKK